MRQFPVLLCNRVLLLLSLLLSSSMHAAAVQGVRLWRAPDHTRLVLDLSGPVNHKIISLSNPERLVIDIPNTRLQASLAADLSKTGISRLRSGVRDGDDLRIVLDLEKSLSPRSFLLPRSGDKKDRLVVDLYSPSATTVKVFGQPRGRRRDIVVAIDAGHGGEDPGAIGPRGLKEKDVVLAISKELFARLKKARGYKPVMVRRGDYYVGLNKRRDIARGGRADLLVSIHADAFNNSRVSGGSVYALSQRGATSTTARFLAMSENKADQVGGVKLIDKDDVLAGVLFDLSMTANLDASLSVGDYLLKSLGTVSGLHKPRVEQANFVVLRSPDIPSVLVETGFISNPSEARKLSSKSHQRKLAGAIFAGLTRYFTSNPPQGSLVAQKKSKPARGNQHVVTSGDTLSEIAQRYQVSIGQLRSHNRIKGNTIRIGQKLSIPTT